MIRHGMTRGNLSGRYVGKTDEPLCAQGLAALRARAYPQADWVIVSPMRRCIETAAAIYPFAPVHVVNDLRECDFGAFEYKNYAELNGDPDYQAWIDSGGELAFPGGEPRGEFVRRCVRAFEKALREIPERVESVAMVVHGGTIMAVLSQLAVPERGYYDWQVRNGDGFVLELRADGRVNAAPLFPESHHPHTS